MHFKKEAETSTRPMRHKRIPSAYRFADGVIANSIHTHPDLWSDSRHWVCLYIFSMVHTIGEGYTTSNSCSSKIAGQLAVKTCANLTYWQVGHLCAHTRHRCPVPPNDDLLSLTCSLICLLLTSLWLLAVAVLCSGAFLLRQNWLHRISEKYLVRSRRVISASHARDQQTGSIHMGRSQTLGRLLAALLSPKHCNLPIITSRKLKYLPAPNARSWSGWRHRGIPTSIRL